MIAFEISINGKNVCVAGVANGLTSAMISRVDDGTDLVDLHVTGTVDPAGDPHSCAWEMPFDRIEQYDRELDSFQSDEAQSELLARTAMLMEQRLNIIKALGARLP
jgi:hypothetical protein